MPTRASPRPPRFRFDEMGIHPGAHLRFYLDPEVAVEVIDDCHVKLVRVPPDRYAELVRDGEPRSLTNILNVLKSYFDEDLSHPTRRWLTEADRLVKELYDQAYPRRGTCAE